METKSKIKTVDVEPQGTLNKDELVTIKIDPKTTDGGIRVNGKLYVGTVKVTEEQATDLMRIADEYYETKQKLMDKNVSVRMKSDFQKERLFLADPNENAGRKGWTRDYGLLPQQEWLYCSEPFKKQLLEQRKALYGY